jgi:hypothetical protein
MNHDAATSPFSPGSGEKVVSGRMRGLLREGIENRIAAPSP